MRKCAGEYHTVFGGVKVFSEQMRFLSLFYGITMVVSHDGFT
jgi:hypothetical protein